MIKKSIFLPFLILIFLSSDLNLNAQEDSKNYTMFESVMLTPDNTKLSILGENMRTHNKKYHKDGPFKGVVYTISTGPNTGKIVWMMGPLMYTHLDSRPSDDGHDDDWRDNVMPYIKEVNTSEYWRMDSEVSNMSMMDGDNAKYPILMVRYGEINEDATFALEPFFSMIGKTIKAMDGDNPWGLYYNEFRQGNLGRHIATVSFLKNWSELDDSRTFMETFHKTIGKNKWQDFLDMGDSLLSNSWDEMWSYSPYMSGK